MTTRPFRLLAASVGILVGTASAAMSGPVRAADAAHPTVVELFQSQGCSSCPPANANVMAIADRPDILALSWQVTYWDHLGWKDTFDDAAFTQRQRDYASAFGRRQVFTPEVVVNGRSDVVGDNPGPLSALIRQADRGQAGPAVMVAGDRATVSGTGARAIVLLVRYDPRILQVPIARGENGGRTLPHRNVVREVVALGEWAGPIPHSFVLPAARRPGLDTAILVQAGRGGPILAAARG